MSDVRKQINNIKKYKQFLNESVNIKTILDLVFQYSPELNSIGTKEQYIKYLKS